MEQAIRRHELLYWQLEGKLDRPAVSVLRRSLTSHTESSVILDLSHVASIDDATLCFLTTNLVAVSHRRNKAMALRGLRQHQLRLLRLLGIQLDEDGTIKPYERKHP